MTTASKHYMFFVYINTFSYWRAYPLWVIVQLSALWIWGFYNQVLWFGRVQSPQTNSSPMKNHGAVQTQTTSLLWTNLLPLHSGRRSSLAESLDNHSASAKFSQVKPKCAFNTPNAWISLTITFHHFPLKNILSIAPRSTIPTPHYIDLHTIAPRLNCRLTYASIALWCF